MSGVLAVVALAGSGIAGQRLSSANQKGVAIYQQATLFDSAAHERFAAFLEACPDVYPAFVRVALSLREHGFKRCSADGVAHVVRWQVATSGRDASGFKINNNVISLMARKAMLECVQLDGFFEVRRLRSV